jgi:hypothetical protein
MKHGRNATRTKKTLSEQITFVTGIHPKSRLAVHGV